MWTRCALAVLVWGTGLSLPACAGGSAAPEAGPEPEEKVSIGYGELEKRKVTGAIASVSAEELSTHSTGGLLQALEGRVAGLEVVHLGNGNVSLRIRGAASLQGNSEPLVVIDGVVLPQHSLGSRLAALSVREVKRVEILKDAGSTAIFGSRGGNGVIVITTKRDR